MKLTFRTMVADDLPQVFSVRTKTTENAVSMENLSNYGITLASMKEALINDVKGWVCEDDQEIVGFCMGNKSTAEMLVLAVLPDHEGCGIAKQLMHSVESWLFDQNHNEIWLLTTPDPNLRAYGFYQYLGWIATGKIIDGEEKFTLSNS